VLTFFGELKLIAKSSLAGPDTLEPATAGGFIAFKSLRIEIETCAGDETSSSPFTIA
jgi:hypothetical protein